MRQHYEWAVVDSTGQNQSDTYTTGPWAPAAALKAGGELIPRTDRHGSPVIGADGEQLEELRYVYPEGCQVMQRVVTYSDWAPADGTLYPPGIEAPVERLIGE